MGVALQYINDMGNSIHEIVNEFKKLKRLALTNGSSDWYTIECPTLQKEI